MTKNNKSVITGDRVRVMSRCSTTGKEGVVTSTYDHFTSRYVIVKLDTVDELKTFSENSLFLIENDVTYPIPAPTPEQMSGIIRKPIYAPGDIIDLSCELNVKLPNRILVSKVYLGGKDDEWMYEIITENTPGLLKASESFITKNKAHKDKPIYKNQNVISMYEAGYRFAGNYPDFIALSKSKELVNNVATIESTILLSAMYPNGDSQKGYLGVWVRYTTVIKDNGMITTSTKKSNNYEIFGIIGS